eukprot:987085_1
MASMQSNTHNNTIKSTLKSRVLKFLLNNNIKINTRPKDEISNNEKSTNYNISNMKISKKILNIIRPKTDNNNNDKNTQKPTTPFVLKNCEMISPITDNDNDIQIKSPTLYDTC